MALEVSPAPAKQAGPERGESAGRNAGQTARGKGGPSDPVGFLALLMSLDSPPAAGPAIDASIPVVTDTDPTQVALAPDGFQATLVPPVIADQPIALAMPTLVVAPDGQARRVIPDSKISQDAGGVKSVDVLEVDTKEKPPVSELSSSEKNVSGLLETKQLQADLQKAQLPQILTRESNGNSHEASAPPLAAQVVTAAGGDPQKTAHLNHTKTDLTEGVVALSGLTGALTGTPDLVLVDKSTQFQSVVAQEVSYYISKDIQNAEMKVEGFGGAAVEVSINMQGKEAQVVFRTDELQTREMLENASAHLKDMLSQEGVQLTGVFVGTAGSGDSGQQDRKFRPGFRTEQVLKILPPEPGIGLKPRSIVGRTLDLYV